MCNHREGPGDTLQYAFSQHVMQMITFLTECIQSHIASRGEYWEDRAQFINGLQSFTHNYYIQVVMEMCDLSTQNQDC